MNKYFDIVLTHLEQSTGKRATMPTAAKLVRNTAINGLAAVLSTFIAIALTSVLLDRLGSTEYGLWLVALTLTFDRGYFALLDLGYGTAALQKLSHKNSLSDPSLSTTIFSTLQRRYLYASVLGIFVILSGGYFILHHVATAGLSSAVWTLILIMITRLPIDMSHAANLVFLESRQMYIWIRTIEISSNLLWLSIVFFKPMGTLSIESLGIGSLVISVLQCAVSTRLRNALSEVKPQYTRDSSPELASEMWRVGKWVALQRLTAITYAQMDRLIIAFLIGIAAVGEYEIPYKIQALGVLVLSVVPSAIVPVAANFDLDIDREVISNLFHRGTRLAVIACVPPLLALNFSADDLIRLWVGADYVHLAGSVRLFTAWVFLAIFHVVGGNILVAMKKNRDLFFIALLSIAINLPTSIFLAKYWGINGVITGTLLGYVVAWIPYFRLEQKLFGAGPKVWFREILQPALIPIALQLVVITVLRSYMQSPRNFISVLFYNSVSIIIAWIVFYRFFMADIDKKSILSSLKKAK